MAWTAVARALRHPGAYAFALLAVLLWSTVASAFKLTLRYLEPITLLLYASGTSTLCLFCVLALQGKLPLLRQSQGKALLRSAVLGLLNPLAYYLVLFHAYDRLPAQEAQPLNYTWPVVLTLLSVPLLRQSVRGKDILALLVSFSGVLVISTRGNLRALRFSDPLGVALAIGSAFLWALYWLFNLQDSRDPVVKLFLNFLFGFPAVAGVSLLTGHFTLPPLPGLLGALYVGLFEMGITFVVWLKALSLASRTAQVSVLVYLTPFLSLIFIHLVVGEAILPSTLIGLLLIVAGILLQQRQR